LVYKVKIKKILLGDNTNLSLLYVTIIIELLSLITFPNLLQKDHFDDSCTL